ncbi:hypothetical protein DICPUDRAFT_156516 [Dictyostelium purpureum]|uniref:DUF4190 domain-containing protein n=1 Tax=Dictyostelium purpureum TaxID=5786 RepID=F0ZWS4_DICPU|nr:uncharacterized protein DICPUDRAFT_156516 [Dictyostelium purpureum]EGC31606.1 hypothetical protein DICPUDRAFT_156516 [Dictyostelium purpureum]|eukprot:XP_003291864.1 hypothetical protein DICPUDRAFT_156516 [Dictyostelium purpureum]
MNNQYIPLDQNNNTSYPPQQNQPTTQFFKDQQYSQPQPQPQVYNAQYYQQPAQPAVYGQPAYASTTVSVTSSHHKSHCNDDHHVLPAVILFVLGWFFYIPWIINIMYIKSKNGMAKGFAIASVVFFFIGIIITVIYLIVFFVFLDKVSHAINTTSGIYTTTGVYTTTSSTSGFSSSCDYNYSYC